MWSASTTYGFQLNHSASDADFSSELDRLNRCDDAGRRRHVRSERQLHDRRTAFEQRVSVERLHAGDGHYRRPDVLLERRVPPQRGVRFGAAPVGLYSFDAVFTGGSSATDNSVVIDVPLELEIVNTINATVTTQLDTNSIGPGQTATVSATLQNNMTDRSFVTTTWFLTGEYNGPNSLSYNFVGNWFDQTIAPSESLSGQHLTWTDTPTVPPGTYVGTNGIVGGLYNGDNFYFAGNSTSINVTAVPEPMSLLGLALGAVALVRRGEAREGLGGRRPAVGGTDEYYAMG